MPNHVFSFNEFLFEGTMRDDKKLDDKEQKKFNQLKLDFLKKQIDLCKKHNVKCFIDYGSLLGLYREGQTIKNDNDTDVSIFGETVTKEFLEDIEKEFKLVRPTKIGSLAKKMFSDSDDPDYHEIPYIGLSYVNGKGKEYSVKSMSGKNVGVSGDFFFHYPYTGGKRITRWPGWEVQLTPDKYFQRLGKVTIDGYDFPIPSSTDDYLAYIYGDDWKTPKSRAGVSQKLELISREEGHNYQYSHKEKKYKK